MDYLQKIIEYLFIWIIKTIRQSNALPFRNKKFRIEHYKNLYEFWVTKSQNKSIQNLKNELLLNLSKQ